MSNIQDLKEIMKEINQPNEYEMYAFDLQHPFYWIFKVDNVRVKKIFTKLEPLRLFKSRFDVFINGLFIASSDYIFETRGNDLYIKFIRSQFPELDRFDNPYEIEESDEVKIKGDLENL
jgi:hypothetical protein